MPPPPAPIVADVKETTGSIGRVERVKRPRGQLKQVERRRYYEPPQRSFADILLHGIR